MNLLSVLSHESPQFTDGSGAEEVCQAASKISTLSPAYPEKGVAQLHIETGLAVYIGPIQQNTMHRHFAVQWSLALNDTLAITRASETSREKSIVIAPGVEHDIQCRSALTILAHPLSPMGQSLQRDGVLTDQIRTASERALREDLQSVVQMIHEWPPVSQPYRFDPRITLVLNALTGNLLLPAGEAAQLANLSLSRFLHLFKEETGMVYRRMILWNRIMSFFEYVNRGFDITGAALEAGFADSAHLSRSVRQAFGLTPREITAAFRNRE